LSGLWKTSIDSISRQTLYDTLPLHFKFDPLSNFGACSVVISVKPLEV
jgi:hypothetical protein